MSLYLFGLEIEMRHYLYILQVLLSEGMFAFFFSAKKVFFSEIVLQPFHVFAALFLCTGAIESDHAV